MAVPLGEMTAAMATARKAVEAMTKITHQTPGFVEQVRGDSVMMNVLDALCPLANDKGKTKHAIDLVEGFDGPVPKDLLVKRSDCKDFAGLPEPFGLRQPSSSPVPCEMSMFSIPREDGKFTVFKHLQFDEAVERRLVHELVYGEAKGIQWGVLGNCAQEAVKVFELLLNNVPGQHSRVHGLVPKVAPRKSSEKVARGSKDEGFDYIIQKSKEVLTDTRGLAVMRFATSETEREGGPLHGWPTAVVEKALHQLQSSSSLAKSIQGWYLPLAAFEPFLLEILKEIWPTLDINAIWWLGVPGVGKTPAAVAVALAKSRFHGGLPSCLVASELDFFRQAMPDSRTPCILDDFDSCNVTVKAMKAFFDVGSDDRGTWARWGGCRFEKGCFTEAVDNKVNLDAEVNRPARAIPDDIDHHEFMGIIKPAFHKDATESDKLAELKRANTIVPTADYLYYRPATGERVKVKRLNMMCGKKDFIKDSWKHVYNLYKKGAQH